MNLIKTLGANNNGVQWYGEVGVDDKNKDNGKI